MSTIDDDIQQPPFMGLLNDQEIRELCIYHNMIEPYEPTLVRSLNGVECVSYGQSSFGYDIRAWSQKAVKKPTLNQLALDPLDKLRELRYAPVGRGHSAFGVYVEIPPSSYILAESVEWFNMPKDVLAMALGKSRYARIGVVPHITPLEPGWRGRLVIEIANNNPETPARVYLDQGIAQLLFFRTVAPEVSYDDRPSNYQDQAGLKF